MEAKRCRDCDSEVKGIRGLCLEHRAQSGEELLAVLRDVAAYWAGGDVPEELDARMREVIARAEGRP